MNNSRFTSADVRYLNAIDRAFTGAASDDNNDPYPQDADLVKTCEFLSVEYLLLLRKVKQQKVLIGVSLGIVAVLVGLVIGMSV